MMLERMVHCKLHIQLFRSTMPIRLINAFSVPVSLVQLDRSVQVAVMSGQSLGNYLFTGVVSVTLNFHPQGRNVNDVTNEGKS